jgi:RecA-family ATPase
MEHTEPMSGAQRPALTPDMILADIDRHTSGHSSIPGERTGEQLREAPGDTLSFLVDPIFQTSGLACLAGTSDTGKSALLRQLCTAISTGESEWLGFPLRAKHHSAIYVSTEDGEDATRIMMKKQAGRYDAKALRNIRFIFEWEDIIATLDYSLSVRPADIVVIDCFSDTFGGDLKDTQKIRSFLQPFQSLADRYKCLVLFLHHTGKRTESLTPSKNNLLSGQGFEAKMRLVIELRPDHMRPHDRHLCIVKGNYLPGSMKKESHILHFDETTLTFSTNGERTPFELLSRGYEVEEGKAKYEQAKELRDAGRTNEEIAKELGYGSRSTVSKLFERAKKLGWDADDAEEEEI